MDVNFEIIEHIGVLSIGRNGWSKEINIVSWNKRSPKFDIRDWDEKMGKGITLTAEEFEALVAKGREFIIERSE